MNNNEKVLPATKTPARYKESSIRFRDAWLEFVEKEELVKFEIVNMIKILEADGYARMEAIRKIVNDHNDLPGFSQATIFRQLPDDMKHSQKRDLKQLKQEDDDDVTYKDSDLSCDKSENINITTAYEVKNAEIGEAVDDVYNSVDEYKQEEHKEVDPCIEHVANTATKFADLPLIRKLEIENNELKKKIQEQENGVIYDPGYVKSLEEENKELKQNFKADYLYEIKDQELPVIVTANAQTKSIIKIELDKKKAKKLGVF